MARVLFGGDEFRLALCARLGASQRTRSTGAWRRCRRWRLYGNCLAFQLWGARFGLDTAYDGNALETLFAACLADTGQDFLLRRFAFGMPVVYLGRKTGPRWRRRRDNGSAEFDDTIEDKRPNVQSATLYRKSA